MSGLQHTAKVAGAARRRRAELGSVLAVAAEMQRHCWSSIRGGGRRREETELERDGDLAIDQATAMKSHDCTRDDDVDGGATMVAGTRAREEY